MQPVVSYLTEDRHPAVVRTLLHQQAHLFGGDDTIASYVDDASNPDFDSLIVTRDNRTRGAILTRRRFPETVEVHLLVVDDTVHRTGIGSFLLREAATRARTAGAKMLTVRVLIEGRGHQECAGVRTFYEANGFIPLDNTGPTVLLAKHLTELQD
ncbi:GNAT family N-acetyltransferase [Curtobacterium sp. MCSS17_016]|uniref:GNAT family N-acetyltransferase n=1 Tax=Curtobacterium sp. MCSS17_016 TaxID=2175644 RepID=UPI0015E8C059|nr:GNAT family N-acetyltransferase [Curtobacterium sp. MCSS17_016]WIE81425.1 GNAT family N-acetyltransferase [Curtobacterium sp. MCSS17_016]